MRFGGWNNIYFSGGHFGESIGTFGQGQFLYDPSGCTHAAGGASAVSGVLA